MLPRIPQPFGCGRQHFKLQLNKLCRLFQWRATILLLALAQSFTKSNYSRNDRRAPARSAI
jgi:hypothetical protein